MEDRVMIPGSEAHHDQGGLWVLADQTQQISPTTVLRRSGQAGDVREALLSGSMPPMSREEAETSMRADPADLSAVLSFAAEYGLLLVAENAEARTLQVQGTLQQVGDAFGIAIEQRIDPAGREYLSYQGALSIPANLQDVIEAVIGLDQRPIARRGAAQ